MNFQLPLPSARARFIATIGALFFWIVPLSVTLAQTAAHSKMASRPDGAVLRISTRNPVPLHKGIHSASTADIFFTKNPLGSRDILADPFFSQVKALNLQSLGFEQDASAVFHHVVIGDTRVSGGRGDGYNFSRKEFADRGKDIGQMFDGVGAHHIGNDFFNEYCAMLAKLGIPGAITANTQTGSVDEIFWEIEQAHAKRVVFGLEQVTQGHSYDFPNAKAYVVKIAPWVQAVKRKYPDVITVLDTSWEDRPAHLEWNRELQRMKSDQVRIYLWDRDLYAPVKAKDAALRINEAFTKVLPPMIERIHKAFPDRKISVLQWGLKPGQERQNTVFGCLHVAKMYQWMITFNRNNNNLIDYASFTNMTNLLLTRLGVTCHYYAMKLCGQLFRGTPNVLESSVTGASGVDVACCEEKGKLTLLMINANNAEIAIPSVLVDRSPSGASSFHKEAISGKEMYSSQIAQETGDSGTIILKPHSVNVIRF